MTFRERISVGDHDGHHPFACDVCQVIDLAVREYEATLSEKVEFCRRPTCSLCRSGRGHRTRLVGGDA